MLLVRSVSLCQLDARDASRSWPTLSDSDEIAMMDTYEVRAKMPYPSPKLPDDPEDVPWAVYQTDLPLRMVVRPKPKWFPNWLWMRLLKWLKHEKSSSPK